jgi:hypothetical protein
MHATAADPELLNHYTVVIYPFRHDLTGCDRAERLDALAPRWAPWCTRLADDELAVALEESTFFLPYIRGLLFPEVIRLQEETAGEPYQRWVQLLRRWAGEGVGPFCRTLPQGCVVRLTARPGLAAALSAFTLVPRRRAHGHVEHPEVPARFDWTDVLLFPCGMGFLLLKARVEGAPAGLASLIRLNDALRLVHPPPLAPALPLLRFAGGEELTVPDLLNFLTQGLAAPWDVPEEERAIFPPATAPGGTPYTDTNAGRAYGERCHLLSYACVDLASAGELPAGPFPSAADRIVFEYATCIRLGESVDNPVWVPTPENAQRLCRDNRLALWRCWTGMVLKESFVFLGTEDLSFNRRSLPRHVENDYLPLYLYTLYQKFQLFTFSTDLMREVALSSGHLRGARALAQRFVGFRSRYWFGEVTRKPQGGELYRTLQRGLEVPALYDMVTSSVREVKDYYEGVWARQVQWVKDVLTYGGPATVAAGAMRMLVGGNEQTWTASGVFATLAVAAVLVLFGVRRCRGRLGWRWLFGRRRRRASTLSLLGRALRPTPGRRAGEGVAR